MRCASLSSQYPSTMEAKQLNSGTNFIKEYWVGDLNVSIIFLSIQRPVKQVHQDVAI